MYPISNNVHSYPDLSHLSGELSDAKFKEKVKFDMERGNILINKAILQYNFLQTERDRHSRLYKTYSRLGKGVLAVEVTLTSLEVGLSGVAVIATPLLPIFGIFALGAITSKVMESLFNKKCNKHKHLALLASSKINSMEKHFSKAMEDGVLSQEEYIIIKNEVKLYLEYKDKNSKGGDMEELKDGERELLEYIRKLKMGGFNQRQPTAPPNP